MFTKVVLAGACAMAGFVAVPLILDRPSQPLTTNHGPRYLRVDELAKLTVQLSQPLGVCLPGYIYNGNQATTVQKVVLRITTADWTRDFVVDVTRGAPCSSSGFMLDVSEPNVTVSSWSTVEAFGQ
jgi:hypothetical protein